MKLVNQEILYTLYNAHHNGFEMHTIMIIFILGSVAWFGDQGLL